MGEDESGFLEFAQQVRTLSGQDLQPPLFVWLHLCNLYDDTREFGHLPILRLRPNMETGQVLRRDVRLMQKTVDWVGLFDGVPLLLRKLRALLTHVNLVTPAREPFIGARFPAYPAIVTHCLSQPFSIGGAPLFSLARSRISLTASALSRTLSPEVSTVICAGRQVRL